MIYNPDGSPMTDSQKSNEVYDNKTSMANMRGTMSQASSAYSKGDSLLSELASESSAIKSSPFVLNKSQKQRDNINSVRAVKANQQSAVESASSLSASYDKLVQRNDILVNGTIGGEIVKNDAKQRSLDSQRAINVRIQSDPHFSLRYSASQSASASIASLSPSAKESMLNSVAKEKRFAKNTNLFDNNDSMLTPAQRNYLTRNDMNNSGGNNNE